MHDSGESVDERLKDKELLSARSTNKSIIELFSRKLYLINGNSNFECPSCTARINLNNQISNKIHFSFKNQLTK